MKKSTKGAIAAGGAAALLLGGAGTLAYWNATATISGGDISMGELKLTESTTAPCATEPWMLGSTAYVEGATLLVPGDVLTKSCEFDIVATGDNLEATAAVTNPTSSNGALPTTVTAEFKVGADSVSATMLATGDTITDAENGQKLFADISVTVDQVATVDNSTQTLTSTLSDASVVLTQSH